MIVLPLASGGAGIMLERIVRMSGDIKFWAHTPNYKGEWQDLAAHLLGVAEKTASRSAKFGANDLGYMAGLLHDLGKFRPEFQDYLWRCHTSPTTVRRGEVPHAAYSSYFCKGGISVLWTVVAGHHAGIYQYDPDKRKNFEAKWAGELKSLPTESYAFEKQY